MNQRTSSGRNIFSVIFVSGSIIICGSLITACTDRIKWSEEIEAQLPDKVDFNYHIKPILSDRCFVCHGPDENKREAGLRLDIRDSAFAAIGEDKDHFAIVPGKSSQSAMVERIMALDAEIMMPPPNSNLYLSEHEKALLVRWVEQGAEYKPHWSFIKPERPKVPEIDQHYGASNEIDHFIISKLQEKGLKPSERTNKERLIRRVTFDLTGLPPTIEEVDSFLSDNSPDAYEKVVDRLLASPHYGERMASEWLDVARYADSHGYQDDRMRNMWPWRDWVIKSFNENMPYDQFVLWQIAGDLLPNATQEQKLATGFNRNHLQSQEGGIVPEEYRVEYVADRTNTFGTAFLGVSTECARCHDHKYDPVSQKEYFQLYAFFNSINETGQIPYVGEASPTIIITDDQVDELLSFVNEKIKNQEQDLESRTSLYQKEFKKWLSAVEKDPQERRAHVKGSIGHYPFEYPVDNKFANESDRLKPATMVVIQQGQDVEIAEGKYGKAIKLVGDSYVDLGGKIGHFERTEPFSVSLWFKILKEEGIDGPIFSKTGGFANGFRGYELQIRKDGTLSASINHTWPANSIEVHTKEKLSAGKWIHLAMTYDGSSRAQGVKLFVDGSVKPARVITDNLKQSILYSGKDKAVSGSAGNLQIGKRGTNFAETLDGALIDEFMVFDRKLSGVEIAKLSGNDESIQTLINKGDENGLFEYYLAAVNRNYQDHLTTIKKLRAEENELISAQQEVMVMSELREPRSTYILNRGAYDAPTEEVAPGTPAAMMEFPVDLPKNRLGLAKWLIHPEHPLTARVAINRYWQMIFGQGLVRSSNDFGNQGELPSHPELLDWLAVEFRESEWNVKRMIKLMVTSSIYQQSSLATKELIEKDPDNVWLARAPSYRMPAEMIRDNALAASGLLVRTLGGPSVKPYQPEGLWEELSTANVYKQDTGRNLYRRSLYTIWKRSSPPPSMINFDASTKFVCTVKRQTTNTPLQALVLLNDPQYIEASRILAEKMIRQGADDLKKQIEYGFKAMTSRNPDEVEFRILLDLYKAELKAFEQSPGASDSLLNTGEFARDYSLVANKAAALTVVANALVNYDEAVYKR